MSRRSSRTRPRTWAEFKRWCAARGLKALPAHAWTIAVYLRWVDRREGAQAARLALDAIAREHLLRTTRPAARHPIVVRTLALIERRDRVRAQHAALFDERTILDAPSAAPAGPDGAGEHDQHDKGDQHDKNVKDDGKDGRPPAAHPRRGLAQRPKLKRRRPGGRG